MPYCHRTAIFLAIVACSLGAWAQTATEHTQHHPAEPTSQVGKAAK